MYTVPFEPPPGKMGKVLALEMEGFSVETSQLLKDGGSVNKSSDSTSVSDDDAIPEPYKPLTGRRLLLFSVLIVWAYLFAGMLVFTLMSDMTILDALYFSVVTLTTVGYGDLSAHNSATKLFVCLYILVGVAMIGAFLANLVEILLEQQEDMLLDILKRRKPRQGMWGGDRETFAAGWWGILNRSFSSLRNLNPYHVKVGAGIAWFVALTMGGAAMFKFSMGLSFIDAFYLTVVSASTVGFGDFSPKTTATKIFAIFYLPTSTLLLAKIISDYTEMTVEANSKIHQKRILLGRLSKADFDKMDENRDGKVDKWEYLVRQLVRQEKITQEEIDQVWDHFKRLDTDNSGFLEFDEVSAERDINNDGIIDMHEIQSARALEETKTDIK